MTNNNVIVGWANAARVLGCSRTQVRRLADRGDLQPEKDAKGRYIFMLNEIEGLKEAMPSKAVAEGPGDPAKAETAREPDVSPCLGETTALIFSDLEAGKSLVEIVIARELAPALVEKGREAWTRLKQADLNAPSVPRVLEQIIGALHTLQKRISEFEASFAAFPLPERNEFMCNNCSKTGMIATRIRCTACGEETWFGFFPPNTKRP